MISEPYPILEFDPAREAMIEPSRNNQPLDVPKHCVVCFFNEVIAKTVTEHKAKIIATKRWEDAPHHFYEITVAERRLAFFHPGLGAPISAALLEQAIALGCRKFIVCGGCGVLDKDLALGNLVVVTAAVRDEGVSYHYLPPTREVKAHPAGVTGISAVLTRRGLPHRLGKTWTTDAPYRETPAKVAARRAEGCSVVEMEAAALMAVAAYRGAILGQVLYSGDDLSGTQWDHRNWQSQTDVRENLFWLAVDACLSL